MLKRLFDAALDLVFPPREVCPLCGGHSPGAVLCPECQKILLGYAREKVCSVCGSFGGADLAAGRRLELCPVCRWDGRAFDLARAAGPYEGPLKEAVHRFKYKGVKVLARPLGLLMADAARHVPAYSRTQALVPVPLSAERERKRGFNQALLLARELENHFNVSVLEQAVIKIRDTKPQAELSRKERLVNLTNSFVVAQPDLVEGRKITIIDDVITTGSTVSIISHILRQSGAAAITVLTLAGTRYHANN